MADRRGHLGMLDGIRGIAATLVVVYHLGWHDHLTRISARMPAALLKPIAEWSGLIGVPVFFVLSGYLMAASIARSGVSNRLAGQFMAKRLVRLCPPYYASIVMAILVAAGGAVMNHEAFSLEGTPLTSTRLLAHLVYGQGVFHVPHIVSVYWTLVYEMAFYLCCAAGMVVLAAVGKRRVARRFDTIDVMLVITTLAVAALAFGHAQGEFGAFSWLRMANCFVLGLLVQVAARRPWVTVLAGGLALVVLTAGLQTEMPTRVATVGAAVLILTAARRDRLGSWFTHPILGWVGKVSFSLYLVHAPILSVGQHLGERVGGLPGEFVAMVAGVVGSFVGAYLLWRFVEQPAQRGSAGLSFARQPDARPLVTRSAVLHPLSSRLTDTGVR